jgi:PEP-CTERM motif
MRVLSLTCVSAALAISGLARASLVTTDPNLPPLGGAYVYPANQPDFQGGGLRMTFTGVYDHVTGPATLSQSGADELEQYGSVWSGLLSANLGPFVSMSASGTAEVRTLGKWGVPTGTFSAELLAMDLSGSSSDGPFMIRESPSLASHGQTTITPLGGGQFQIDSFFDVFTELSLDGGVNWIPSQGPSRVVLLAAPEPSALGLLASGAALVLLRRRSQSRC